MGIVVSIVGSIMVFLELDTTDETARDLLVLWAPAEAGLNRPSAPTEDTVGSPRANVAVPLHLPRSRLCGFCCAEPRCGACSEDYVEAPDPGA
jgi:hypothetical protein